MLYITRWNLWQSSCFPAPARAKSVPVASHWTTAPRGSSFGRHQLQWGSLEKWFQVQGASLESVGSKPTPNPPWPQSALPRLSQQHIDTWPGTIRMEGWNLELRKSNFLSQEWVDLMWVDVEGLQTWQRPVNDLQVVSVIVYHGHRKFSQSHSIDTRPCELYTQISIHKHKYLAIKTGIPGYINIAYEHFTGHQKRMPWFKVIIRSTDTLYV